MYSMFEVRNKDDDLVTHVSFFPVVLLHFGCRAAGACRADIFIINVLE
jgi:hypothetical protein